MGQNTEERLVGDSAVSRSIRATRVSTSCLCCDHTSCRPAWSGIQTTEHAAKALALPSPSVKDVEVSHNASQSNMVNISGKSAGGEALQVNTEQKPPQPSAK